MVQHRGRRSTASLSVRAGSGPPPIEPPDHLSEDEAAMFREIVAECKPGHFVPTDRLLLAALVHANVLMKSAFERANRTGDIKDVSAFERSARTVALLATKLRLAPQSRMDGRVAERGTRRRSSATALLGRNDEEDEAA